MVGVVVMGRRGFVVEWGTPTAPAPAPIAGMAIGVAAGGRFGNAETPPSGTEGFIGLWVRRGGVWVFGMGGTGKPLGVELGGVPTMRIGFWKGCCCCCWCGMGTRSLYEFN